MIQRKKCIVLDVDGTLCPIKQEGENYADIVPYPDVLERVREYRAEGFYIILNTARNMNSYDGNVGLITANTGKLLLTWLDQHDIPYDELHLGKPWPGKGGFYVDDKTVRPNEFLTKTYDEILKLVNPENPRDGNNS